MTDSFASQSRSAIDLTFNWLNDPSGIDGLAQEWEALADRVGTDAYLRPDWQSVWWAHFGSGRRWTCLVARSGGALVGVLPFVTERFWLGPLPMRVARLAGTDPHCIIFQLPVEPVFAAEVLRQAVSHLIDARGCVAVSFSPISELSTHLAPLRDLPDVTRVDEPAGSHTVFDLPDQFELYLKQLASKRRTQIRSRVKGLEETFAMTSESVVADVPAFDEFVAFHNTQWQAVGRGGHFVDWPGSVPFYRDYVARSAPRKRVWLYRLHGATGPIATQFCLNAGNLSQWRLPARNLDPAAEKLGSGTVGLVKMIEDLIDSGVNRIEAGRGEYSYKLDYGGRKVPLHRLILAGRSGWTGLRLRALLAGADLVDLLYYRIWFLKLAPRLRQKLGLKPRPLWRLWIRSRF